MKNKTLLTSLMSIALLASISVGATYALFTSESQVNIAVTSGKVSVVASIDSVELSSMGKSCEGNTFENGGTAVVDGNSIKLINMTPGDAVKVSLNIVNESNVAIYYRVNQIASGALANYLEINNVSKDWTKLAPEQAIENSKCELTISLPKGTKNDAQNLEGSVSIVVEAIQANAFGENATAKLNVGDKGYSNHVDAIAAAKASGEPIEVVGTYKIPGGTTSKEVIDFEDVTFVGGAFGELVFCNSEGSTIGGLSRFSNINLKDITVVDETFYNNDQGEGSWEFTYLEFAGNNAFENVVFTDGIMVVGGESEFKDCEFIGHNNDSSEYANTTPMYGAWVYSGEASFTECDFSGTRGLKVADQYSDSDVTEVIVDKCHFGPLSEKPGIAVDNRIDFLKLSITNSTFEGTQPGDQGNYVYEDDNRTPDTTEITLANNTVIVGVSSEKEIVSAFKTDVKEAQAIYTINLNSDIEVSTDVKFAVKSGNKKTLKLNGYKLTGTSSISSSNSNFFTVNGELNVVGGAGTTDTISYEHIGENMGWGHCTTIFDISAGGKVSVEDATVENLGGTDMNFVAHLNNWGDATFTANKCKLYSTYCAVRVFNSGYDMNNVTIKDSELTGKTRAFWIQYYTQADFGNNYNADAVNARLKFDIYKNNNTFTITDNTAKSPIRYGNADPVYYNANGDIVE